MMTTVLHSIWWMTQIRVLARIESWPRQMIFVSLAVPSPSAILKAMSHVAPVFTEYEQQVIQELATHRVQPNAVQRVLEGIGKPMTKLMNLGRNSQNRALRG